MLFNYVNRNEWEFVPDDRLRNSRSEELGLTHLDGDAHKPFLDRSSWKDMYGKDHKPMRDRQNPFIQEVTKELTKALLRLSAPDGLLKEIETHE